MSKSNHTDNALYKNHKEYGDSGPQYCILAESKDDQDCSYEDVVIRAQKLDLKVGTNCYLVHTFLCTMIRQLILWNKGPQVQLNWDKIVNCRGPSVS